jgi:4'-phosphopantetheinyl transferase
MDVYWLEQSEAELPADNDWLSASEAILLSGMRFAKRRADWRLGRWTAKRALTAYLKLPDHIHALADIEIRPTPSSAPEVFVANKAAAVTVSLSHRSGRAVCAVAPSGVELGCDLETIEPHSDAFITDYLTTEEQELTMRASAADRSRLVALLWSGKESALKALGVGLRLDTRRVIVSPMDTSFGPNTWRPLQVRYVDGPVFRGWWQHADHILRTLVSDPPADFPILLKVPVYCPDGDSRCT